MSRQWDKRMAASVIVAATVALSFDSLRKLAEMSGFTGPLGWAWPLCLDAVAYLATRVWLEKGPAYRFARALAIGSIGLSLVANGLVHGLTAYSIAPHWTIVVLVGAVPPGMLALVVHLLVIDSPGVGGSITEPASIPAVQEPGEVASIESAPPGTEVDQTGSIDAEPASIDPPKRKRTATTRSTQPIDKRSRSIGDLRAELERAISDPTIEVDPASAESIRKALKISPSRARVLRDGLTTDTSIAMAPAPEAVEVGR